MINCRQFGLHAVAVEALELNSATVIQSISTHGPLEARKDSSL